MSGVADVENRVITLANVRKFSRSRFTMYTQKRRSSTPWLARKKKRSTKSNQLTEEGEE
jgi:hypothetical protein